MQENQPKESPRKQQRALDTADDQSMDHRPLGGNGEPHEHPFPKKSMDPRPLGAGKSVLEEDEVEDERGTDPQNDKAAAAMPTHDEVDASPEEQFTRHHVELDPEKLHHLEHHKEGPLEQVKKKATDVVRAARAAVEQHLPSSLTTGEATTTTPPPSISPESNQITLQSLKYSNREEPMHMAKVAEGRNRVIDTDESSRKFGMSPASASTSGGKKDDEDFPETLQDAIQDGAHLSEKERKKESEKEDDQIGEDLNEPEPFGVTSGARSKL